MNITIEELLAILNSGQVMTVAGYNGSCERVIRFDGFVKELEKLQQAKRANQNVPR
jgi:hypothetical protein